jgi:hypothetical protein
VTCRQLSKLHIQCQPHHQFAHENQLRPRFLSSRRDRHCLLFSWLRESLRIAVTACKKLKVPSEVSHLPSGPTLGCRLTHLRMTTLLPPLLCLISNRSYLYLLSSTPSEVEVTTVKNDCIFKHRSLPSPL